MRTVRQRDAADRGDRGATAVIERILRHLGLWQRGPPSGRQAVVDFASAAHEPPYVAGA